MKQTSTTHKERGSALLLVMIGIIVLSLMGIFGLRQTTTDLVLARNFVDDKIALFTADSGVSIATNELRLSLDPRSIRLNTQDGNLYYKTGRLSDTTPQYIQGFTSFEAPPPIGMSVEVGSDASITLSAWEVIISSIVSRRQGDARKEINAVVVTLSPEI